jgi:hypothetical protein
MGSGEVRWETVSAVFDRAGLNMFLRRGPEVDVHHVIYILILQIPTISPILNLQLLQLPKPSALAFLGISAYQYLA